MFKRVSGKIHCGGTRTRGVNREDRPGQYVAETDLMKSPYVGFGHRDGAYLTFRILTGEKAFIDPNIYWDCPKGFLGDTPLPVTALYPIPDNVLKDGTEIVFGYENLLCSGYQMQEGLK